MICKKGERYLIYICMFIDKKGEKYLMIYICMFGEGFSLFYTKRGRRILGEGFFALCMFISLFMHIYLFSFIHFIEYLYCLLLCMS